MSSGKPYATLMDTKGKLSGSSRNSYHDPYEYCSLDGALNTWHLQDQISLMSCDKCVYLCMTRKYNVCPEAHHSIYSGYTWFQYTSISFLH